MNVLSLFDGISCGMVALERAGIEVNNYYASEIDKYAIEISKNNYPKIIQLGSVTDINFMELPKIDLLIGGSPCQDLSIAKRSGKGLDGEKSGLFYKYVEALETLKPKYFLLENVASMKNSDKDKISQILGVAPIMINSTLLSAQQRKRYYWTNISSVILPEDKNIYLKNILEHGCTDRLKNYCITATYSRAGNLKDYFEFRQRQIVFDKPERIAQIGKGGQGDRIYSIDGKSVSLSANGGGRGAKTGLYYTDIGVRKLTPIECERLQTLPDNYTEGVSNSQRYKMLGNGWTVDVIAHILKGMKK
jgi:DNA (cytosine-5)-methyltransferase 3A